MTPIEGDDSLRRLRRFEVARNAAFWIPVYFLLFDSELDTGSAFSLAALYYLASIAFELPAGLFSDRFGRRRTLIAAASLQLVGALGIAVSDTFAGLAAGQVCIAAAIAFVSGTDTSMLFEHLRSRGQEQRIADEEARLQRCGLHGLSFAAVAGGLLGAIDLRLPYVATAIASAFAIKEAVGMAEPRHSRQTTDGHERSWVGAALRDRTLRWCLLLATAAMVFNHVPFEMIQPYLANTGLATTGAPVGAGLLLGATMWLATWSTRAAPGIGERLGLFRGALLGLALQGVVIGGLAIALHPALALFMLLRSVPQTVIQPLLRALIHPRVADDHRATWFSIQSFVARLAFAACLGALAIVTDETGDVDGAQVLFALRVSFAGLVASVLVLWGLRPRAVVPGPS